MVQNDLNTGEPSYQRKRKTFTHAKSSDREAYSTVNHLGTKLSGDIGFNCIIVEYCNNIIIMFYLRGSQHFGLVSSMVRTILTVHASNFFLSLKSHRSLRFLKITISQAFLLRSFNISSFCIKGI